MNVNCLYYEGFKNGVNFCQIVDQKLIIEIILYFHCLHTPINKQHAVGIVFKSAHGFIISSLSFNYTHFHSYGSWIYPSELDVKDTT